MKLLHLSDLHIGKRVNEFSMLEDQKHILTQILEITDRERPEGILLAGDIYDKPVPPTEAVQMLDDFFTELAERNLAVFAVSGNHDSPERLSFGSRLFQSKGLYLLSIYDGQERGIVLEDEYGTVTIHLLPFVKPSVMRHVFIKEEIPTCEAAVKLAARHMNVDRRERNVLVAHQFVTGARRCESEELQIGGVDQVSASVFDDFDYVALGHLHSPQSVGRETVRYCGTPLKYSFSEADQEKSVTVVELEEKGCVKVRQIPLKPIRDMRKIRGTYMEVTNRSFYEGTNTEDYIHAVLTDEEDIPDGIQKLRVIYPNILRLEYDNLRTRESREIEGTDHAEEKTELELFEEFYKLQNNQAMSLQQRAYMEQMIEDLRGESQEI